MPRVFGDLYSFLHVLLGVLASALGIQTPVTLAYLFYQALDDDEDAERLGDVVEYVAGLVAGAMLRLAVAP